MTRDQRGSQTWLEVDAEPGEVAGADPEVGVAEGVAVGDQGADPLGVKLMLSMESI